MLRKLAKDSAIYGSADLLAKLILFISFPLVASALKPAAFGMLELIATASALIGFFVGCGLNNAVSRYYWDEGTRADDRPRLVTSAFAAQLAFGLFSLCLLAVFSPGILWYGKTEENNLSYYVLVAASLLMVFKIWVQYVLDVLRLHMKSFRFCVVMLLSHALGAICSVIAVVSLDWQILGFLGAQALAMCLALPLGLWLIRSDIVFSLDWIWLKRLIKFGYPYIFATIAYWLMGSIDRWMLAEMVSMEAVGVYSVAARFAMIVVFISTAFGTAWSPYAIKLKTDHPDTYRSLYMDVLLVLIIVMLVVGGTIALFSGELIGSLMPAEYVDSSIPLAILCFGVVLQSTLQISAIGISLAEKSHLIARSTWMAAFVNIALNWILIPLYGVVGASVATLLSYLFLTSIYFYYTQRVHRLPLPRCRLICLACLACLVFSVSIYFQFGAFDWKIMAYKISFALVCLLLSLPTWPKIRTLIRS